MIGAGGFGGLVVICTFVEEEGSRRLVIIRGSASIGGAAFSGDARQKWLVDRDLTSE